MENYLELEKRLSLDSSILKKKSSLLSNLRLLFFVLLCISGYFVITDFTFLYFLVSVLLMVLFLYYVTKSTNVSKKLSFVNQQLSVLQDLKIDDLEDEFKFLNDEYFSNVYNKDLDILEGSSLFNRLNKTQSLIGNFKLKYFLSNVLKGKIEILDRQLSIAEIQKKNKWSVEFLTYSRSIKLNRFKIFEEFDVQFPNINLRLLPIVFALVNFLFFIYLSIEGFPKKIVFFWVIGVLLISQIINLFFAKRVNKTLSYSVLNSTQFENLISLVKHIENESFDENLNKKIKSVFIKDEIKASNQLKEVQSTIDGLNALTFPIVGFVLNSFCLWKLYYTIQFEKKISTVVKSNEEWLEAVSILEAFISFSIFNNKFYTFSKPIIIDNGNYFNLVDGFHPLLSEDSVIKNSFQVNNSQSISIITGANMAGKSTFLRTIGVNLVLAMNGLNVSAKEMSFFPMDIFTSIRTVDDLANGDSYFKNEINKLKILIDRLEDNMPQFIILDEILKGTNSKDKLIGSQKFLEKLINSKANLICFIATHDLELTKMESDYPVFISNYCFELKNINDSYFSDYILRQGTTQIMNAIYLMQKYNIID